MTDDDNLATAPIPVVIRTIKEFDFGDHLLLGLYLNVLANRLQEEHDRAEGLQRKLDGLDAIG